MDESGNDGLYENIAEAYRRPLDYWESAEEIPDKQDPGELMKYRAVSPDLRTVEHQPIIKLRDDNQIGDTVWRKLA